jgi:hydrogenase-4 component B
MSLVSYFLVVTEHKKADVQYAGFFYLVMTHVGTAFVVFTYLILFQSAGSFSFDAFRHPEQALPEGMRTLVFLAALFGFGTKAGIVPLRLVAYAHPAALSYLGPRVRRHDQDCVYALIRVYFDFLGDSPWWWFPGAARRHLSPLV